MESTCPGTDSTVPLLQVLHALPIGINSSSGKPQSLPTTMSLFSPPFLSQLVLYLKCLCVCMLNCYSHIQLFATPWTVATRLLCPCDSLGKDTGVCCHALLQGTVPVQGLNPCLSHLLQCHAGTLPLEPLVHIRPR